MTKLLEPSKELAIRLLSEVNFQDRYMDKAETIRFPFLLIEMLRYKATEKPTLIG